MSEYSAGRVSKSVFHVKQNVSSTPMSEYMSDKMSDRVAESSLGQVKVTRPQKSVLRLCQREGA